MKALSDLLCGLADGATVGAALAGFLALRLIGPQKCHMEGDWREWLLAQRSHPTGARGLMWRSAALQGRGHPGRKGDGGSVSQVRCGRLSGVLPTALHCCLTVSGQEL